MNDKKITLEIEQLEERIAPSFAPGFFIAQSVGGDPSGSAQPGLPAQSLWFAQASDGNGASGTVIC